MRRFDILSVSSPSSSSFTVWAKHRLFLSIIRGESAHRAYPAGEGGDWCIRQPAGVCAIEIVGRPGALLKTTMPGTLVSI
jgi:hypothetical protein